MYYLCSENKGADQLRGYKKLICVFVFAYAKSRFSHDEAQLCFTDRLFRLKMFNDDQGSWMIMFLITLITVFIMSLIYNGFLSIGGDATSQYRISDLMGVANDYFMKAAACGTWCGDFFTAWMVSYIRRSNIIGGCFQFFLFLSNHICCLNVVIFDLVQDVGCGDFFSSL